MAYTKDYYHILALRAPTWTSTTSSSPSQQQQPISAATLRRAYKLALLAAHPDKQTAARERTSSRTTTNVHTVDDVKEAYTVLADERSRRQYTEWWRRHGDAVLARRGGAGAAGGAPATTGVDADFVLGLEVLDLEDFEEEEVEEEARVGAASGGEPGMRWTRACRCGDEKGFCIREEELERAEERGEREVLVGCEGCSLWVRVGFAVEEEEDGTG